MRKITSFLLAVALIMSSTGCGAKGTVPANEPKVYTATTKAHNGDLTLDVAIADSKITAVTITNHAETAGIADMPIEELPKQIVEKQTIALDAVSGATVTSKAILTAVEDAIKQAGLNVEDFKKISSTETTMNEPIEKSVDVVVIGAGGAGLSASVSAVQNGAKVLVLEKMPKVGGNTLISGSAYNAVAPDRQASQGIEDSIELHYTQTLEGGDNYGDPELVRTLVENSYPTLLWLEELGVKFQDEIIQVVGALHQRGFEPVEPLGTGYINAYLNYLNENNTEIMVNTVAEEIILENGKVVGVKAISNGNQPITINASQGVILATGGFGADIEFREKYNSQWPSLRNQPTTNHSGATGEGIMMAEAVGAALTQMEFIQLHPMGDPETGVLSTNPLSGSVKNTIYVNKEGTRFTAEDGRRDTISKAALEQTDGMFYAIMDTNTYPNEQHKNNFNTSMEDLLKQGKVVKAESIQELAEKLGIDAAALNATIDAFNASVDAKTDDFGRKLFDKKIENGPFYAGARKPTVHHTMGGVKINTRAEVVSATGEVIPNFYAAGEVTGGIHGANRLGGNALADINVFGKIAGENAAKNK
ncbi:MAG: flavocytochrome c [Angelakisella sp.]